MVERLIEALRHDPDTFIAERDRRRLAHFNRRMVPGYIGGHHITRLVDALEGVERGAISRLMLTMPPRHSKSLNVSELFPAWYLGRNPDKRIIAASHTAHLAHTFSRRVRNRFNDPAWPFPDVRVADDKGAVQAWDIEGHMGGYVAVGVGGTPVGLGGHCLVIDDPIRSAADADSQTVRDALWEWYQGTIYTRRQPGAALIVTATRWHEDDLIGRLLAAQEEGGEQWHHLHFPAIDDRGNALWPEFWPVAELDNARLVSGPRVWEAQYQGRPIPTEGAILKEHHWSRYRKHELPERFRRVAVFADTAHKTNKENDYTAMALWGEAEQGWYLLDLVWGKWEFPELLVQTQAAWTTWRALSPGHRPTQFVVEDASSGTALIQTIRKTTRIPIVEYKADRDKVSRVHAISGYHAAGKLYVPATNMDGLGVFDVEAVIAEHTVFPRGKHDDVVDCTSSMLLYWEIDPPTQPVPKFYAATRVKGRW